MAFLLIHRLREQLAPGCLPIFTSDGLTAHFGHWIKAPKSKRKQWQVAAGLLSGQVKKSYRRRRLVRVKQVIRLGTGPAFTEALQALGWSGRVNTACIERVNLTLRRGVAALARRTWTTALQTPHLEAHLHWWQAYYHFVRPHASLRVVLLQGQEGDASPVRPRYRQRTEADGIWPNQSQVDHTEHPLLPAAAAPRLRSHASRKGMALRWLVQYLTRQKHTCFGGNATWLQQHDGKSAQNWSRGGLSNYPPCSRAVPGKSKRATGGASWCESSTSSSWGHRQHSLKPYRLWASPDE